MPKAVVEEGRFDDAETDVAKAMERAAYIAPLRAAGTLGTREEIEAELDLVIAQMRVFGFKSPDQVLREVMAYGARLTELSVLLHRAEAGDRRLARIRTMQVAPIQEALERQYRIASRLIEQQRLDLELIR